MMNKKPFPLMVDFSPAPALTDQLIRGYNDLTDKLTPQELSTRFASNVAAIAFVMHSTNSTELIKNLFSVMVEDAGKQYRRREKEIAEMEAKEATKQ